VDAVTAREKGIEERGEWQRMPWATSDSDGRFRLRGVPTGPGFLVGDSPATYCGWSEPFDLAAGEVLERTLVLPTGNWFFERVRGKVLDPGGEPLEGIKVEAEWGRGVTVSTDGRGAFEFETHDDEPIDFVASDPQGRFGPALLEGFMASTREPVVLQLVEPSFVTVEVRDPSGHGIPGARVSGEWLRVNRWGGEETGAPLPEGTTDDEGRARLVCPAQRFRLHVRAAGFWERSFDPFEPRGGRDEPLLLVLEPAPCIRGRVVHRGQPIAGALVSSTFSIELRCRSQAVTTPEQAFDLRGSVTRKARSMRTDGDGRFVVNVGSRFVSSYSFTLDVRAEGYPETLLGPLFPPHPAELEIELEEAGAIEGEVRLPPGESPLGRVVGACRGYTLVWTAPVDSEGRYRIEGLAPGEYQVRPCLAPSARERFLDAYGSQRPDPIVWDCRVDPGGTTRFDLDLRAEGSVILQGHLSFPVDRDFTRWAVLHVLDGGAQPLQVGQTQLRPDGDFELRRSSPGKHRVEVWLDRFTRSEPISTSS
jgi:hypothetical protein